MIEIIKTIFLDCTYWTGFWFIIFLVQHVVFTINHRKYQRLFIAYNSLLDLYISSQEKIVKNL